MISGERKIFGAYWPLFIVICVVVLASIALQIGQGPWWFFSWIHDFMGLFLVIFAMFKLFDVEGFAEGFAMYDLIARRSRLYGVLYPLIELCLGVAYLGRLWLWQTYLVTAVVMLIGSLGVLSALRRGLDVHCACLGTFLKVPLSTVAILEDVGMGLMALLMLVNFYGFLH